MVNQCCVAGEIHTGTPTGRISKVHGFDCYTAEPPNGNPKGVVVILPDAFGWDFNNNRILADDYAKKGNFLVYLPDFMAGTSFDAKWIVSIDALYATGILGFFTKIYHMICIMPTLISFMRTNKPDVINPRISSFLKAVRNDDATKRLSVGTAGFCWGGYYTIQLCHDQEKADDGRPLQDCGFTAHPSQLTIPDDIQKVKLPLSVATAGIDMGLSLEKADELRKILEGLTKKNQGEHEYALYDGAHHGFAVRGSKTDEKESKQGLEAEDQAINWFNKWFS